MNRKINIPKIVFLMMVVFIFGALGTLSGQSQKELESQKKKNQQELKKLKEILAEAEKSKSLSENKLNLINKNIEVRKEQVTIISSEIGIIQEKIEENTEVIVSLEGDFKKLKDRYAKMLYFAYKHRHSYYQLMFILAADNFNQAYKRLMYIKEYTKYRKKQISIIQTTQKMLAEKISSLENKRKQKDNLIKEKEAETIKLSNEKAVQAQEINSLKKKEKEIREKLAEKRKEAQKIEAAIQKAIAEAQATLKKTNPKADARTMYESLTKQEKIVSDQLGSNMGGLPWPTERGVISSGFGKKKVEGLDVWVDNSGVDITTTKGANVRSVFEGKVIQIISLPTGTKAVLMQHGVYFTLYSNLKEVYVVVGDKLDRKESVGVAYTDPDDNQTIVHFEIWKEFTKMNPALWLAN
ncbi:MAG: hypothetical protein A2W91_06940 [Bacteroidetes bacterium GWF2_38_335]|nr:MAG: hypothetical protein A2W91_06940 [Bacteroidetes bacterium GWF2_38_335]OFY80889.1 MAG: hypothetical protein A2281_04765 [Bacteroidetes bacterium RIFOXYA12_FULL_38_20]HBS84953.1 hypothetical protein [Bacteroidales bacterium]